MTMYQTLAGEQTQTAKWIFCNDVIVYDFIYHLIDIGTIQSVQVFIRNCNIGKRRRTVDVILKKHFIATCRILRFLVALTFL